MENFLGADYDMNTDTYRYTDESGNYPGMMRHEMIAACETDYGILGNWLPTWIVREKWRKLLAPKI